MAVEVLREAVLLQQLQQPPPPPEVHPELVEEGPVHKVVLVGDWRRGGEWERSRGERKRGQSECAVVNIGSESTLLSLHGATICS